MRNLFLILKNHYKELCYRTIFTTFLNRYDPKRSCYVPHTEEKFVEGMIQETTGGKVKVQILGSGETKEFKQDLVTQVLLFLFLKRSHAMILYL